MQGYDSFGLVGFDFNLLIYFTLLASWSTISITERGKIEEEKKNVTNQI